MMGLGNGAWALMWALGLGWGTLLFAQGGRLGGTRASWGRLRAPWPLQVGPVKGWHRWGVGRGARTAFSLAPQASNAPRPSPGPVAQLSRPSANWVCNLATPGTAGGARALCGFAGLGRYQNDASVVPTPKTWCRGGGIWRSAGACLALGLG